MNHDHERPLATYDSLADGHLAGYFANSRMQRHLQEAGLITKRGEIVPEAKYKLNMRRKEHKMNAMGKLMQAIVHKTIDMERSRQAEIKKKLEEIGKIQRVHRVQAMMNRRGYKDVLPVLTFESDRRDSSPSFTAEGWSSHFKPHPNSAPEGSTGSWQPQMSAEEEEGLDTIALRRYGVRMAQMEKGCSCGLISPYMIPPKAPKKHQGWALKPPHEKMDPTQEVVTKQQRCGGNTVFKEPFAPRKFISYRHHGYPFKLYLDGQMGS